jgi:two-component system response regulator
MENKTILLVEDNSDDEMLMLRALQKNHIANDVIVARDGVEALDYLFGKGQYDGRDVGDTPQLMLLDLKLPKIDGLEVLQEMRNDERTRYIPVVILTSSSEQQDIVRSYDLGANSFVQKPVDFHAFIEATQQLGTYWLILNRSAQ